MISSFCDLLLWLGPLRERFYDVLALVLAGHMKAEWYSVDSVDAFWL